MNNTMKHLGLMGFFLGASTFMSPRHEASAQPSQSQWQVPRFKGSAATSKGKDALTAFLFEYSGTVVYVDVTFSRAQMRYAKKRILLPKKEADSMDSGNQSLVREFLVRVGERPLQAWYVPLEAQSEDQFIGASYINIWLPTNRERLDFDPHKRRLRGYLRLFRYVTWSKGNYFNAIASRPPK